jgi:hypothetical protein
MVYRTEVFFPAQLDLPVSIFLQDQEGEPDGMIRRMHQLVEVHQTREQLFDKAQSHEQKIKEVFDKKVKKEYFRLGDLVLKWDAQKKDNENMVNSNPFGFVLLKFPKFCKIILLSCKIWKMLKFLVAQSMGIFKKNIFLKPWVASFHCKYHSIS